MKLSCDIIKDLLPLYCDNICSDETKAAVEEHLADCVPCSEELKKMKSIFPVAVLQNDDGGLIIGGYKINLIKRFILLLLCSVILPLVNAFVASCSYFGDGYIFLFLLFSSSVLLTAQVFIPAAIHNDRKWWLIISSFISPILILAAMVLCFYSDFSFNGPSALLITLTAYPCCILSGIMYIVNRHNEALDPSQYKKTGLKIMILETAIIYYIALLSALYSITEEIDLVGPMMSASYFLLFAWLVFLFFRFLKRKFLFNLGVCIGALGIYIPTYSAILNWNGQSGIFQNKNFDTAAVYMPILIICLITAAALMLISLAKEREKKKQETEKERNSSVSAE